MSYDAFKKNIFFKLKYTPDSYNPSHTVLNPHVRALTKNQ